MYYPQWVSIKQRAPFDARARLPLRAQLGLAAFHVELAAEEGAAAVLPWWALLEADAPPLQHQQEMSQEVPPQEMVLQVPPQQLSVLHAKRVLCQIAETNANRELSRRAMRAINTLRLAQHEARSGDGGGGHALRLMAFDEAFSPRNLVLIGAALNATVQEESVGKVVSAV